MKKARAIERPDRDAIDKNELVTTLLLTSGIEGLDEGTSDGALVGPTDGMLDDLAVGLAELDGALVGFTDGTLDGNVVGLVEGVFDGLADGLADGTLVDCSDGKLDGLAV